MGVFKGVFNSSQSYESCGPLLLYVTCRPHKSALIMAEGEERLLLF